jgi:chromosome segregation ATPase
MHIFRFLEFSFISYPIKQNKLTTKKMSKQTNFPPIIEDDEHDPEFVQVCEALQSTTEDYFKMEANFTKAMTLAREVQADFEELRSNYTALKNDYEETVEEKDRFYEENKQLSAHIAKLEKKVDDRSDQFVAKSKKLTAVETKYEQLKQQFTELEEKLEAVATLGGKKMCTLCNDYCKPLSSNNKSGKHPECAKQERNYVKYVKGIEDMNTRKPSGADDLPIPAPPTYGKKDLI